MYFGEKEDEAFFEKENMSKIIERLCNDEYLINQITETNKIEKDEAKKTILDNYGKRNWDDLHITHKIEFVRKGRKHLKLDKKNNVLAYLYKTYSFSAHANVLAATTLNVSTSAEGSKAYHLEMSNSILLYFSVAYDILCKYNEIFNANYGQSIAKIETRFTKLSRLLRELD